MTVIAWALHLAADVTRGLAAGRVPWANMYEFALTGTLVITTVYLLVLVVSKHDLRFLGTFVTGLVLVLLGVATVNFYVERRAAAAGAAVGVARDPRVRRDARRPASSRSGSRSRSCSCCRRAASRSWHPRRP